MSKNNLAADQRGVASIIVTIIMMVVISLIVVGFAQVARRNAREALDRQLSTQAYYAAESGVNDVSKTIRDTVSSGGKIGRKDSCTGGLPIITGAGASSTVTMNSTINADAEVSYSCLLVDPNPRSLIYTSVREGMSTVVPIDVIGSSSLSSLTFQWTSDGQAANPTLCNNGTLRLPTSGNWRCNYAILRIDLVKIDGSGNSANALNSKTSTFYLKPYTTATPLTITSAFEKAYIANSSCPTSGSKCTSTINIDGAAQGGRYYARITGIYKDARNVQITGRDTSNSVVGFENAQVLVDSTGKARDQLRRISVRVPISVTNSSLLPTNSLQTAGDICKRFTTGPSPLVTNTEVCQGY